MPNPRAPRAFLSAAKTPLRANAPRIRSLVATACVLGLAASLLPPTAVFAKKPVRHARSARAAKKTKKKTIAVRAGFVRVETAKLRKSPGSGGRTVGLLDAGRTARVIGRKQGWLRIKLGTGTEGWVRSDLLKVSRRPKMVPVAAAPAAALAKKAKTVKVIKAAKAAKMAAAAKAKRQRQIAIAAKAKSAAARKNKLAAIARARKTAAARGNKPKANKRVVIAAAVAKKAAPRPVAPRKTIARVSAPVTARFFVRGASAPRAEAAANTKVSLPNPTAPPVLPPAAPAAAAALTSAAPRVSYTPAPGRDRTYDPAPAADPAPESSPDVILVEPSLGEPVALADQPTDESAMIAAVRAAVAAPRLPSRNERIVRTALTYRGTPYRFGARGRGAFDCSGFTSYLFNNAGAGLPRTAAQQFKRGRVVPKNQLQPGDLVFFKNTYRRGVSHVGIFIGNDRFVHAAGKGRGVRVDRLTGRFYRNHWAGARRPM